MTTCASDPKRERGEVHPYILFAGIALVLITAFLGLMEAVAVDAARYQMARSVMASLRGAARMQDFRQHGALIEPLARTKFEQLVAGNLGLETAGHSGQTLQMHPRGIHPYIQGTTTAEFWVVPNTPLPSLVSRVRAPLRMPLLGPVFRRAFGREPAVCLSLAVTPHDLYGGESLEPQEIPAGLGCTSG